MRCHTAHRAEWALLGCQEIAVVQSRRLAGQLWMSAVADTLLRPYVALVAGSEPERWIASEVASVLFRTPSEQLSTLEPICYAEVLVAAEPAELEVAVQIVELEGVVQIVVL